MKNLIFTAIGLLSVTASSAEPLTHTQKSPSLAVRISIADPCINSHYVERSECMGKTVHHEEVRQEKVAMRTVFNDPVPGGGAFVYTIRTTDFY